MDEYFQTFSQVIMARKNVWKYSINSNDWHLYPVLNSHFKLMYYFVPPKNLKKYSFLKLPEGKKWNIGLVWIDYVVTSVKPEQ